MATVITVEKRREDFDVTAVVTSIQSSAETALGKLYASLPKGVGAAGVARARAFARFERSGLPTRRIEAWHYTDMRSALREAYPLAFDYAMNPTRGLRIDLIDGAAPDDLGQQTWPEGLRVRALRDVLAGAGDDLAAKIYPDQGANDAMVALNAAMSGDGLVIEVATGARIETPIGVYWRSGGVTPRSDFSRVLVLLGDGAHITLVESHAAHARTQRNSAIVFHLAAGASVEHVFVPEFYEAESHVATLIAELGECAAFNSFALIAGGGLLRRQIFARCAGEQADVAFRGVSLLGGKQHADTTLVVDHAAPHGRSRELFKHIVTDGASGVFQGKVIVRPHAQKVDGGMKSQTLLLSDDAAMYNKPELEIFADDVVCGHGATVGELDKDQLFYLMARGLTKAEAEALLLDGFAREAIEFVSNEDVRSRLETLMSDWLESRPS